MTDFFEAGTVCVPANFGPLRNADGNARVTGPCGDTMEFWISVTDGKIDDARFTTDGCMSSNACGSFAALLARGKPVTYAESLMPGDILSRVNGISTEEEHCAVLAVTTLRRAIENWKQQSLRTRRSHDKVPANPRSIINPRPKLIVSCRGTDGTDNALVVVYAANCSFDPCSVIIGVVPSRFSYHLIKDSGCFVVNLPSKAEQELYDYLGSHSGRDGNKLAACNARMTDGEKVNAPMLLDCPINIECTVTQSIAAGSHELFIGRIKAVHVDREYVTREGNVNWDVIDLI